jgi:hypothetical protein
MQKVNFVQAIRRTVFGRGRVMYYDRKGGVVGSATPKTCWMRLISRHNSLDERPDYIDDQACLPRTYVVVKQIRAKQSLSLSPSLCESATMMMSSRQSALTG